MKLCIYHYCWDKWNKNSVIGGTETWIIETSKNLSKLGVDVTVRDNIEEEFIDEYGVKYTQEIFDENFDVVLMLRNCYDFEKINSENIFLVSHDMYLDNFTESIYKNKKFKGVLVLSKWQKGFVSTHPINIEEKSISLFQNGYNSELYNKYINYGNKENAMVWSSRPERGSHFFINEVLPLIRKQIPDFKVYFASYCEIPKEYYFVDGVVILGHLNKKLLRDYQYKSKIWIYPNLGSLECEYENLFFETFCITAVENAMAGNAIITNDGGGLSSTLEGYKDLLKYDETSKLNRKEYAHLLADKAIEYLQNEEKRKESIGSLMEVTEKLTWENVTSDLLKTINKKIKNIKLCVCVKNENLYLRDWVEYYKKMGINEIFLCDNNNINGEFPQQVIGDFILNGFVKYFDYRGEKNVQYKFYSDIYKLYGEEGVWFALFDADEFYNGVDIFTLLDFWEDFDEIILPWEIINDNNLLHYDNRNIIERFGTKGIISDIKGKNIIKYSKKRSISPQNGVFEGEGHKTIWIKGGPTILHYYTKSIEEYLYRKFGTCSYANDEVLFTKDNLEENFEYFKEDFIKSGFNKWNDEKEKIFSNFKKIYTKTYGKRF